MTTRKSQQGRRRLPQPSGSPSPSPRRVLPLRALRIPFAVTIVAADFPFPASLVLPLRALRIPFLVTLVAAAPSSPSSPPPRTPHHPLSPPSPPPTERRRKQSTLSSSDSPRDSFSVISRWRGRVGGLAVRGRSDGGDEREKL
ncbi:hypothetical protein Scep_008062 [Stephania cephalantha]|uniref:Uncharacterized protein n=1 Tax=Stephania cephalantha TaxID=152367 RepID=A0AAP0PPB3_9MAGN